MGSSSLKMGCATALGCLSWAFPASAQFRVGLDGYVGLDSATLKLPSPGFPSAAVKGLSYGSGVFGEADAWGPWQGWGGLGAFGFLQEAILKQTQFGAAREGEFQSHLYGGEISGGIQFRAPSGFWRAGPALFCGLGLGGTLEVSVGLVKGSEKLKDMWRCGAALNGGIEIWRGISLVGVAGWYRASVTTQSENQDFAMLSDPTGKSAPALVSSFTVRLGVAFRFGDGNSASKKEESAPRSIPGKKPPKGKPQHGGGSP